MTRAQIIEQIFKKKTFLCVGLDTDLTKIPKHLLTVEDPIFEFNKAIIDHTAAHCVAYKPNAAFYEAHGLKGWMSLQKTVSYLKDHYPDHFVIADAKRGDIGNTASMYAQAFFKEMKADAITVAPYMGKDSVEPFLKFDGHWAIVLGVTSNNGALDFQFLQIQMPSHSTSSKPLFMEIMSKVAEWGTDSNLMFVVGATRTDILREVRSALPNHFFLVPGVGAQGGDLKEVIREASNQDGGLLINASRSIIYASAGLDFAERAGVEAMLMSEQMQELYF
jgi:orotidine-5'-phosphate decarboxylase